MTPEQKAALLPSKTLFELCNALIFHLFERNLVDPSRIAALLEERQTFHKTENPDVALVMQASIDWLKTLRAGESMPPSTLH
jgi:hypothetical protein